MTVSYQLNISPPMWNPLSESNKDLESPDMKQPESDEPIYINGNDGTCNIVAPVSRKSCSRALAEGPYK